MVIIKNKNLQQKQSNFVHLAIQLLSFQAVKLLGMVVF